MLRTRVGALAVLVVVSSTGLVAAPAEARPDADLKRTSTTIAVPKKVAARVHGRDIAVSWHAPSAAASLKIDRWEVRYRQSGQARWSSAVSTTKRTVRVENLVGGRRASFEVRARSGSRSSAWSADVTAVPVSRPGRVQLMRTSTPDRTVRLTWAAPVRTGGRKIDRYEVMYRATGSGAWRHLHRSIERATITGLRNARTYSFRVRAENAVGAGPWTTVLRARPGTAPATVLPPTPPPVVVPAIIDQREQAVDGGGAAAPVAPTASDVPAPAGMVEAVQASPGVRSVALSWAAPTTGGRVEGYEVRVRVRGTTPWSAAASVSGTSAVVGDLVDGGTYEFAIRATGPAAGSWSGPVTAVPGAPTAPSAPMLRFADRALSLDTTWSDERVDENGSAVNGWEVRYRAAADAAWTVEEITDPTSRTLHLQPLTGGFGYRFSVRARNASGGGPWSSDAPIYVPVLTLPVLSVDTAGGAPVVSKDDYVSGAFDLDPNGSRDATGTAYPAISGTTDIKGRGNSTWTNPKKPYRLKLGTKTELLGMPANRNWVLLADYYDHSLLRNETALYLGSKTSLAWTPRTRFVEVLLNGDYLGLYQLAEQVRIDPDRIDIKSMKAADTAGAALTGGYQLERDERWNPADEAGFTSSMGQPIVVKDPEDPSPEQTAYIEQYVDAFETALQSSDRGDAVKGYAAYIDVDSFVDWYIVEELVQNVDANFASMNLYKPRGGKLTLGPLWDFDLAFENAGQLYAKRETWWVKNESWWPEFFKDPSWERRVEARWRVLSPSFDDVHAHISATQAEIATAAAGNSERWGPWGDFDGQVRMMHDFLTVRAAWLDTQWGADG